MKRGAFLFSIAFCISVSVFTFSSLVPCAAGGEPVLSKGQTIYVPVYSHIIVGAEKNSSALTCWST
jgi:hypothetical protein